MNVNVGKDGVTVPKRMLGSAEEVEIRTEDGRVVIEPTRPAASGEDHEDPIFGLGTSPVEMDITDASENHDRYLYGTD